MTLLKMQNLTVKRSVVARDSGEWEKDEQVEHRRVLGQRNYSVGHCIVGYVTIYV